MFDHDHLEPCPVGASTQRAARDAEHAELATSKYANFNFNLGIANSHWLHVFN